jgi:hypothetical protein
MDVDKDLLKRLRSQMLIHCYLYYWGDSPVWTDEFWQSQANRLEKLQKDYLEADLSIGIGFYDDAFEDFTGSTGAHLPRDEYVISKSTQIYRIHSQKTVDFNGSAGG